MFYRTILIVLGVLAVSYLGIRMVTGLWIPAMLVIGLMTISIVSYFEDDNVDQKETRLGVSLVLSLYLPFVLLDLASTYDWLQAFYLIFYFIIPMISFLWFQSLLYKFKLFD
ncbi:hypothetical protein [Tenuibacillus multivorans]|uniref:Uncharacterized protein n=1 Tax=Tenuibacillus multivorans TaxID=237069 RepID=A0A1G9WKD3_9BACI|nr:hypothetical protein [Tenuibacillus multivorans]GEL76486.1 hypothetical protein TMU01_07210 [Tenuibacillus multivorans]SDM84505.1 hypothetical protein SAMN05216498_0773 [Tenuibacillus multivorans]